MAFEIRDDAFDLDALVLADFPYAAYYDEEVAVPVPTPADTGGVGVFRLAQRITGRVRVTAAPAELIAKGRLRVRGTVDVTAPAATATINGQVRISARIAVTASSVSVQSEGVIAREGEWIVVIPAEEQEDTIVVLSR